MQVSMFPLGSVLLPHLPLGLRLFEPRYLTMFSDLLEADRLTFGVVLIERGQEVGGGDHRFPVGTLAEVVQAAKGTDYVGLTAVGTERFVVERWLDDDPYPRAEIRVLDPLGWDDSLTELRERVEIEVRRSLAVANEYVDQRFDADVELSDDPEQACWQLAGIAPVGEIDQLGFLRARSMAELLTRVLTAAEESSSSWRMGWSAD